MVVVVVVIVVVVSGATLGIDRSFGASVTEGSCTDAAGSTRVSKDGFDGAGSTGSATRGGGGGNVVGGATGGAATSVSLTRSGCGTGCKMAD